MTESKLPPILQGHSPETPAIGRWLNMQETENQVTFEGEIFGEPASHIRITIP